MRCHRHGEVEAAAICVSCGQGVCRDCRQATTDQRTLCGLPQCAEFANKQKAVQFAIRQECANRAAANQMTAAALRSLTFILLIPSVVTLAGVLVLIGVSPLSASADQIVLLILLTIVILVARSLWRIQKGMGALARNMEDVFREFG
jgi:hypothetical protein